MKQFISKYATGLLYLLFAIIAMGVVYGAYCYQKKQLFPTQVVDTFDKAIEDGHFPCYQVADSIHGIDQRGTDSWCETAMCEVDDIDIDYVIRIHYDTVWLYTEDHKLIRRGDFDSISHYIEQDNL